MVDLVHSGVDIFVHLDTYLGAVIRDYGAWTHLLLAAVVFCETGLVVTPLLPGDSLLFAAGAFAALGDLRLGWMIALLSAAAVAGDTVNYWAGSVIGPRAFSGNVRFLKKKHLDRTRAFYGRHGGKTIILARFIPIIRTFAPFVAGIGTMRYPSFLLYNVVGGIAWVLLFSCAGYWMGNVSWVRENFEWVMIAIIAISLAPVVRAALARRGTQEI